MIHVEALYTQLASMRSPLLLLYNETHYSRV